MLPTEKTAIQRANCPFDDISEVQHNENKDSRVHESSHFKDYELELDLLDTPRLSHSQSPIGSLKKLQERSVKISKRKTCLECDALEDKTEKEIKVLKQKARNGDLDAMLDLANRYRFGDGVKQNLETTKILEKDFETFLRLKIIMHEKGVLEASLLTPEERRRKIFEYRMKSKAFENESDDVIPSAARAAYLVSRYGIAPDGESAVPEDFQSAKYFYEKTFIRTVHFDA